MKSKYCTAGLALLIVTLSLTTKANADEFTFTFDTSVVGCSYSSCTTSVEASGVFTTGSLAPLTTAGDTDAYSGTPAYLITSISGQMNGSPMTFVPGNFASIWAEFPAQGSAGYGLFNFYPVQFTSGGTQWNLFGLEPELPPGANGLIYSNSAFGSDLNLSVKPLVTVPEPSSLEFVGVSLVALLGMVFFRRRTA